jgi:pyrroline-5-carboxylate reductase
MIKVTIIGSGNVAQHLIQAFQNSKQFENEMQLLEVFARQKERVAHLLDPSKITNDFDALKEADVYIIAVSDAAIAEVSSRLPFQNRLTVHTSGSFSLTD